MNVKILYWTKNPAAQNIMKQFRELGGDVPVFETEKDFLYLTDEDVPQDASLLIIPSTHKSVAEKKSLTIHATGNFGNADYGGEPRKLNPTSPAAIAAGLRSMATAKLPEYEVCMEVTHHGPTLKVPLVFIEIGASEKQWADEAAGKVVANAVKDILENTKKFENYIGFGGPHYAPSFSQIILDNPDIALGHILPNYHADHITKGIVQQMLKGSDADKAVFDWKGMKSEPRGKTIGILEELGIEYCKTSDLH